MEETANKIFDLEKECNFIPLCVETRNGGKLMFSTDILKLTEMFHKNTASGYEEEYVIPDVYNKEVFNLWENLIKESKYYNNPTYETRKIEFYNGDGRYDTWYVVFGFSKTYNNYLNVAMFL